MKKNAILLVLTAVILGGCSGIKVVSDFDPSVDFTQYQSYEYYGWLKNSDELLNDLDKRRIEAAFGAEFEARGMKYVEEGGDLVVGLYVVTEQKTKTTAQTTHMGGYGRFYGYGPGWGWGGGYATTSYSEYNYTEGTLVCDVYDKAKEQLIWEGIGTGTVDKDPSTRDENIPAAVKKIMEQYPVAPKTE